MKKFLFFTAISFIFSSFFAEAKGKINGEEIVKRADQVMIGNEAKYKTTMVIKRPKVEDVVIKYKTFFKERGRKVLVRILYPPKEIGKDLLLIKNNMWQYIPNVERSVRIAGSQRFMGGEFNNSDLLKISLVGDYNAKLIKIEKINNVKCYYLILKAKNKRAAYDRVNYWVRTKSFIPYQEEYITKSGKKMKYLLYSDIGKLDNRIRPRKMTMINFLRPNHKTYIIIQWAEYDKKIPNYYFSRTYLERKRN